MHDKHHIIEEPCEVKVSCTVLKTSGAGDSLAEFNISQRGKPPTKWQVYEQILRVPYYIVFSRYTDELQIFRLLAGVYEPTQLTEGRFFMPQLGLHLGLWQGSYESIERLWLRWFTAEGELILTPSEEATTTQARLNFAEQEAAEARQRAERLAAKLRELNIDPDELE